LVYLNEKDHIGFDLVPCVKGSVGFNLYPVKNFGGFDLEPSVKGSIDFNLCLVKKIRWV
jgi:hypothetical protein